MYLSVIIPAYNEGMRLSQTLQKVHSYLNTQGYAFEVIIVDDGSADDTYTVASSSTLFQSGNLRILRNEPNKGKGYSVRKGILAASGDFVLFSDADLSAPIEEIEKLFLHINHGFDIAIGSRSVKGSDVRVHQLFYREYMGKFFNRLVQLFAVKGILDTQCGFKLMKRAIAKDLAGACKIDGFAFDVEMLYLAQHKKYAVSEVPITWINSPKSKVNPVIDSLKMLVELLSIRRIHNGR